MSTEKDENITTCQLFDQCRFTLNPKHTDRGGEQKKKQKMVSCLFVLKVEESCL